MSAAETNATTARAAANVGRNAAILAAATLFCKAGSLAVVPFILRAFSQEDYGEYSAAFAYAGLLGMVAYFGMNPIVIRDIARGEQSKGRVLLHCTAVRMVLLTAAGAALLGVGIVEGFTRRMWMLSWLAFAVMALDAITGAVKAAMQAEGHFGRMAAVEMVRKTTQWGLAIFVILAGAGITLLAAAVTAAAAAAMIAAIVMGMSRDDFADMNLAPSYAMKMLKLAAPMGLSAAFLLALERVDTWMLDTMRGPVEVAVYSAGVAFKPAFLAQSVVWAIMPLAFRLGKENPAQLVVVIRTTARYFLICGAGLAIVFFSGGGVLVPLLAGGQYSESVGVFRILGLSLPFAFLGLLYLNSLTTVDRQMIAAGIVAGGLVVNAALDLVLVPAMGADGAIIATLAAEILMAAAAFLAVWRTIGKPFAVTDGRTLLAVSAAVAVASIAHFTGVPDAGGLGAAALALGLVIFRVVSKADVALLKSAIFVK